MNIMKSIVVCIVEVSLFLLGACGTRASDSDKDMYHYLNVYFSEISHKNNADVQKIIGVSFLGKDVDNVWRDVLRRKVVFDAYIKEDIRRSRIENKKIVRVYLLKYTDAIAIRFYIDKITRAGHYVERMDIDFMCEDSVVKTVNWGGRTDIGDANEDLLALPVGPEVVVLAEPRVRISAELP